MGMPHSATDYFDKSAIVRVVFHRLGYETDALNSPFFMEMNNE